MVLDASDFEHVTLYSGSGEIMFSTEDGSIGQRLAGERARVRATTATRRYRIDGTLSVLVGLRFPSGVGGVGAVELSRPADDITSAAGPWRTMFFLAGALVLVFFAAGAPSWRGSGGDAASESGIRVPYPVAAARPRPRSGRSRRRGRASRKGGRRRAESRAQEAEQRLTLLQDQYRATLEELQATQRIIRDQPPGNDRVLEERRSGRGRRRVPSSSGTASSPPSATGSPASSSRGGTRSSGRVARS